MGMRDRARPSIDKSGHADGRLKVIVVGPGRVGVELALSLHRDRQVTVADVNADALVRLRPQFAGRSLQGRGLDREALSCPGFETADALPAVTASVNVNVIVAPLRDAWLPLLDAFLTSCALFLPPI